MGRLGRTVRIAGASVTGTGLKLSFVGAPPVDGGPANPSWRGYPAEVTETDRSVEVLVREQLPDVDFPPGHGMSRMGYSIVQAVHLARPLADRLVIDLSTALAVPVFRGLLTVDPGTGWTLRSEYGGSTWVQQFTGPNGRLVVTLGLPTLGAISDPSFYERTGATTVRGVSGEWGTGPGETSLRWVEDGQAVIVMSSDLTVAELVEIANGLTSVADDA